MPVKADLDKLDEEIDNQSRLLGWEHTLLVKALSLCRLRRCIQARIKLCCSVGETLKISKRIKKHKCCHHVSTQFSLNLTWNTYSHHTRYQIESVVMLFTRGSLGAASLRVAGSKSGCIYQGSSADRAFIHGLVLLLGK
jgi:hypothetical protein